MSCGQDTDRTHTQNQGQENAATGQRTSIHLLQLVGAGLQLAESKECALVQLLFFSSISIMYLTQPEKTNHKNGGRKGTSSEHRTTTLGKFKSCKFCCGLFCRLLTPSDLSVAPPNPPNRPKDKDWDKDRDQILVWLSSVCLGLALRFVLN